MSGPPPTEARKACLRDALKRYKRIAICGGPRAGKTPLSNLIEDRPVVHTDDYMHHAYLEAPGPIVDFCKRQTRFVLEGVQGPRCLRGSTEQQRAPLEVDAVIWLDTPPGTTLTTGQETQRKGIVTIFEGWERKNPTVAVIRPDL